MYERGISFAVDYVKSATYFKTAAELGMPRAQGRLCLMAIDGRMNLAIPTTREEIGSDCAKGIAANDASPCSRPATHSKRAIDGRMVNPASAADFYDRAAKLGDNEAKVRPGILYTSRLWRRVRRQPRGEPLPGSGGNWRYPGGHALARHRRSSPATGVPTGRAPGRPALLSEASNRWGQPLCHAPRCGIGPSIGC